MEGSDSDLGPLVNPIQLKSLAAAWLLEDCPAFDYGGHVVGRGFETAVLLAKGQGVLAGVPFFEAVFGELECDVEWLEGARDGTTVRPGMRVATVTGRACDVLRGERVALNCLCRASGVATVTREMVEMTGGRQWKGRVAGTRKTTPGFRVVEKYALLVGGADTHRYDISAMVQLKDNHVWTVGDIAQAIEKCRKLSGFTLKIEVECRSLEDAIKVAKAKGDIIMLDNFTPKAALSVAKSIKRDYPEITVEVSGGINSQNVLDYVDPAIDVISSSRLTQGYPSVDFSLKILRDVHDPENPPVTGEDGESSGSSV